MVVKGWKQAPAWQNPSASSIGCFSCSSHLHLWSHLVTSSYLRSREVPFWRWWGVTGIFNRKYLPANCTPCKKHFRDLGEVRWQTPSPTTARPLQPHSTNPHTWFQNHAEVLLNTLKVCIRKERGSLQRTSKTSEIMMKLENHEILHIPEMLDHWELPQGKHHTNN